MSQICGVVCPASPVDCQTLLDKMCDVNWRGTGTVRTFSAPGAAMALWSPPGTPPPHRSQAAPADSRGGICVFCGRAVWNGTTDAVRPDEALTGARPLESGDAEQGPAWAPSRLNGIFAGAHWDAAARRLALVTDRYSYRPLYYFHDESRGLLAFSSRLMGLVRGGIAPIRPNWEACSVFVCFAHCLGDETMFEGVRRVPSGKSLTFEAGGVRFVEHWSPKDLSIRQDMSVDEAIEANGQGFERAVRRSCACAGNRPAVFLSGGLDSRLIAAELELQGIDFVTYTTRGFRPGPVDRAAAEEVARRLGVPNTFVNLPGDFVRRCWARAAELADYETDLHQWAVPLTEALPEGLTSGYNGLGGDTLNLMVLSNGPFRDMRKFHQAEQMTSRQLADILAGPPWSLGFLSKRLRRRLSYDAAIAGVERELARYEGSRNRLTLFTLLGRTRRSLSLASLQICQQKVEPLLPFMDNDYFELAMSIPPEIRIPRCLRTDVLNARYPKVSDIPMALRPDQARLWRDERDDFAFGRLVRQLRWQRVCGLLVRNSWMFHRPRAAVRAAHYLLTGRDYMFNERLSALLTWLATFFPGGMGI